MNIKPKTYNIDYTGITSNYLDTDTWGKEYTLFQYKEVTVILTLANIDVQEKSLSFRVRANKGNHSMSGIIRYYIDHPEYTLKILRIKIEGMIVKIIEEVERQILIDTKYYQTLREIKHERALEYKRKAHVLLEELKITNEEIIDAYTSEQEKKGFDEYDSSWYLHDNQYTVFPDLWVILAQLLEREQLLENVKKANSNIIDFEKYVEEVLAQLEETEIELDEVM